ncbi:hypothetical protein E4U44_004473 [Claviceps purpurea]|nr:hypothetical protein E4U44_004473 [Claviceps purpurea]
MSPICSFRQQQTPTPSTSYKKVRRTLYKQQRQLHYRRAQGKAWGRTIIDSDAKAQHRRMVMSSIVVNAADEVHVLLTKSR